MKDRSDRILERLRKGGLVISGRGTGKTRALVHYAKELILNGPNQGYNGSIYIITNNSYPIQRIIENEWPVGLAGPHIVTKSSTLKDTHIDLGDLILVDDYFHSWYHGHYHVAVGTLPHGTSFIGSNNHAEIFLNNLIDD